MKILVDLFYDFSHSLKQFARFYSFLQQSVRVVDGTATKWMIFFIWNFCHKKRKTKRKKMETKTKINVP